MPTETIEVPKELMEKAFSIGTFETRTELLEQLLGNYIIRQEKLKEVLELKGTVEYFDNEEK